MNEKDEEAELPGPEKMEWDKDTAAKKLDEMLSKMEDGDEEEEEESIGLQFLDPKKIELRWTSQTDEEDEWKFEPSTYTRGKAEEEEMDPSLYAHYSCRSVGSKTERNRRYGQQNWSQSTKSAGVYNGPGVEYIGGIPVFPSPNARSEFVELDPEKELPQASRLARQAMNRREPEDLPGRPVEEWMCPVCGSTVDEFDEQRIEHGDEIYCSIDCLNEVMNR